MSRDNLPRSKITNFNIYLSRNEVKGLKELYNNPAINLKKAGNGTITVIMNKAYEIYVSNVQLDNPKHDERLNSANGENLTQEMLGDLIN